MAFIVLVQENNLSQQPVVQFLVVEYNDKCFVQKKK